MKILRITSKGYENGGVENGILLLQPVLEAMGHTVKTLSSTLAPEREHFNDFSFDALEHQPRWQQLIYRLWYPAAYVAVKRVLDEFRPDIVQIHTISQMSPSVLFALRNYPVVQTVHQVEDFTTSMLPWSFPRHFFRGGRVTDGRLNLQGWLHYLYHRWLGSPVYRRGFRNVDTFVVFSTYMQKQLEMDGIASVFVPNATRLFEFVALTPACKTVAYVGRLEFVKGVDILLEAFREVLRAHPTSRLAIAGTGGDERALKRQAQVLGINERVQFLGQQSREQVFHMYAQSAVVVMPSLWPEAFGKVGIEAMSVGRPVIASDVGGISQWLVDGQVGILVPPGDVHALAQALSKLFADPMLLNRMSVHARAQSERFGIEDHARSMVQLYDEVITAFKRQGHVRGWHV